METQVLSGSSARFSTPKLHLPGGKGAEDRGETRVERPCEDQDRWAIHIFFGSLLAIFLSSYPCKFMWNFISVHANSHVNSCENAYPSWPTPHISSLFQVELQYFHAIFIEMCAVSSHPQRPINVPHISSFFPGLFQDRFKMTNIMWVHCSLTDWKWTWPIYFLVIDSQRYVQFTPYFPTFFFFKLYSYIQQ